VNDAVAAVEATGLVKRYRRTVALDGCSFTIPADAVVALVGPNGAGKSTLLHCMTGLVRPTEGSITVLGGPAGDPTLPHVGFVAQDAPLYADFTAGEMLTLGAKLNHGFDLDLARDRLTRVGVPLGRRVDRLSGGQRAQVALSLALAKRPGVLLLDEPLASLDPLARREFLSALMDAVAEKPMTVVLSSHLTADLERVCDHLMVLRSGRIQVLGATDDLLATHKRLLGPAQPRRPRIAGVDRIVTVDGTERQVQLLVRTDGDVLDPAWDQHDVTLEDLVLAYLTDGTADQLRIAESVDA
jgi:ABC-2 type transport system ATP-binding protein